MDQRTCTLLCKHRATSEPQVLLSMPWGRYSIQSICRECCPQGSTGQWSLYSYNDMVSGIEVIEV